MVIVNYNIDIGDYIEWSPNGVYAVAPTNEAYKFASITYLIYVTLDRTSKIDAIDPSIYLLSAFLSCPNHRPRRVATTNDARTTWSPGARARAAASRWRSSDRRRVWAIFRQHAELRGAVGRGAELNGHRGTLSSPGTPYTSR
jgi:hypothetical protein